MLVSSRQFVGWTLADNQQFMFWCIVTALVCTATLWLPFGFSLGGMIEEWDLMFYMNTHPGLWNSFPPGGLLHQQFAARPFQITVFWLAHQISPNSFIGFHLFLMLACFIRVVAGAIVGRCIFGTNFYAICLGILAFVFPADTQQLSFRTLNISMSLALAMLGAATALESLKTYSKRNAGLLILCSMLSYVVAVLIYEASITLYCIVPLAVIARMGFSQSFRIIQKRRAEILTWLMAPISNLLYFLYILKVVGRGYEQHELPAGAVATIFHNLHYFWDSLGFRLFIDGWISALSIFVSDVNRWSYIAVIGFIVLCGFLLATPSHQGKTDAASAARAVVCGVLLSVLAYLPFMIAESHLVITQRTMMAASLGGAIVIIALLRQLFGHRRPISAMVMAFLVFVGLVSQLYQLDTYTRIYVTTIRPYMSMLVDRSNHTKSVHLVVDESGISGFLNGMYISKIMYGPLVRQNRYDQSYHPCVLNKVRTPYFLTNHCQLDVGSPGTELEFAL